MRMYDPSTPLRARSTSRMRISCWTAVSILASGGGVAGTALGPLAPRIGVIPVMWCRVLLLKLPSTSRFPAVGK